MVVGGCAALQSCQERALAQSRLEARAHTPGQEEGTPIAWRTCTLLADSARGPRWSEADAPRQGVSDRRNGSRACSGSPAAMSHHPMPLASETNHAGHIELPSRGLGVGDVLQGATGSLTKEESVLGGVARRHYEASAPASGKARPQARLTIRQVPEDGRGASTAGGGRVDEAFWKSQRREHRRPERVHGKGPAEGQFADLSENLDRNLGQKGKPTMEDGTVRRFAPTVEMSIEAALTRRRKIHPADKVTQRNGIGLAKPGDRAVARADYEPGYFKGGGVVVGSTSG